MDLVIKTVLYKIAWWWSNVNIDLKEEEMFSLYLDTSLLYQLGAANPSYICLYSMFSST